MGFDMGLESSRAMSQNITFDEPHSETGTRKTAPFGTWESDITKDAVFSASRGLISPRVDVSLSSLRIPFQGPNLFFTDLDPATDGARFLLRTAC